MGSNNAPTRVKTQWKEGEERMNVIPQNGNDGEHYEEVASV